MSVTLPMQEDVIRSAIKDILKNADLNSLSSKKVRKMLEEKFIVDLTLQKQQVDDVLMELINAEEETKGDNKIHNGTEVQDEGSSDDDTEKNFALNKPYASHSKRSRATNGKPESEPPSKKKVTIPSANSKKGFAMISDSSEDERNDEALARKLQQEELGVRPRSSKRVDKKPKKVSTEKAPRKKGNSPYSQECVLSEDLASVMGTNKMARKDVVSRMWQIFKERNLMDPKQRQYVICDEQLERVFKTKKFKAFGMMRFLKHHIKDANLVQS